jgi:hypothetical protein
MGLTSRLRLMFPPPARKQLPDIIHGETMIEDPSV